MTERKTDNTIIINTMEELYQNTLNKIIKINFDCYVYHYTSQKVVGEINVSGFKTGFELKKAERRKAIFFSDKQVNKGLYSRNKEGELYEGDKTGFIKINIKNLTLLNLNYKDENGIYENHNKYKFHVIKGELENIPYNIDGTISFIKEGLIYEVALTKEVANIQLSNEIKINK